MGYARLVKNLIEALIFPRASGNLSVMGLITSTISGPI